MCERGSQSFSVTDAFTLQFLHHPDVSRFLRDHLQSVRQRMERACRLSAMAANVIPYLAAQSDVWASLDPLRRAEVVLEAKAWTDVSLMSLQTARDNLDSLKL